MAETTRPTPTNPQPPDFGPNVHIFDPSTPNIQSTTDAIYAQQDGDANHFGPGRHAYFLKPGFYDNLNIQMAYYITVHGLGRSPDDVHIKGSVQALGRSTGGMALNNFWRGAENFSVTPTVAGNINPWAVSQATYLRRFHIKGQLFLFDFLTQGPNNYSSGGYMADGVVDKQVIPGSQQQFLTRNTDVTKWRGGVWNMVFVGSMGDIRLGDDVSPNKKWPDVPITIVEKTEVIRDKPYIVVDEKGEYVVVAPKLKYNSQGTSWSSSTSNGAEDGATSIPINRFYLAKQDVDNADTINAALEQGFHLVLTPGIYHLSRAIDIKYPDTIVLGLGMATLTPDNGTPALTIADVPGVSVSGLLLDAGAQSSPSLLQVGTNDQTQSSTAADNAQNPISLHDISTRIGGSQPGRVKTSFLINANNVILDNVWLWRADHGTPGTVGWDVNTAPNGIIVNGNDLRAYGLFVEHFQEYQTVWNGEGGKVWFYQSEIPYDIPDQKSWGSGYSSVGVQGVEGAAGGAEKQQNSLVQQDGQGQEREKKKGFFSSLLSSRSGGAGNGSLRQDKTMNTKGWASYKVSPQVKTHEAIGVGVYCYFINSGIELENAIETPETEGVRMNNLVTIWLDGARNTGINHIINGKGKSVTGRDKMKAVI